MTPTEVANLALGEIGQRVLINSFDDGSAAANAAKLFYSPKTRMLMRSANWDFARAQLALTQWKAVSINGVASTNPPPQPWQYSYLYPTDCLKIRFVQPTVPIATPGTPLTTAPNSIFPYPGIPTAIPFVEATDFDTSGNPVRVVLTNVPQAQAIYTRDLSDLPDAWDPLFLAGATALLGSYFINMLARDKAQMEQQVALAKSVIDQARAANANEAINSIDHTPDWVQSRRLTGLPWMWGMTTPIIGAYGGWDACQFPDGQFY